MEAIKVIIFREGLANAYYTPLPWKRKIDRETDEAKDENLKIKCSFFPAPFLAAFFFYFLRLLLLKRQKKDGRKSLLYEGWKIYYMIMRFAFESVKIFVDDHSVGGNYLFRLFKINVFTLMSRIFHFSISKYFLLDWNLVVW